MSRPQERQSKAGIWNQKFFNAGRLTVIAKCNFFPHTSASSRISVTAAPATMSAQELPMMMTMAVSMEVEKIGNSGTSSDAARIMQMLKHYAPYPNNMAKVLVAIKNLCSREDAWVVGLLLKYNFAPIMAEALRSHNTNGHLISRACEVVSTVSHIAGEQAVNALVTEGTVVALCRFGLMAMCIPAPCCAASFCRTPQSLTKHFCCAVPSSMLHVYYHTQLS